MGPEKSHWNRLSLARKEGRTRGGARGLSLTGVPRVGKTVGHDGVARGGAHQVQICLTCIHSTILCGWGVGACSSEDRRWDRRRPPNATEDTERQGRSGETGWGTYSASEMEYGRTTCDSMRL